MSVIKPAGPRSVWGAGFALGLVLLLWSIWLHPSLHTIWQAPIGLYLVVVCMGKMAAR